MRKKPKNASWIYEQRRRERVRRQKAMEGQVTPKSSLPMDHLQNIKESIPGCIRIVMADIARTSQLLEGGTLTSGQRAEYAKYLDGRWQDLTFWEVRQAGIERDIAARRVKR